MPSLRSPEPEAAPSRGRDDYARIAAWYDPVTARLLRPLRRRIRDICVEEGWERILDYGCGTGEQLAMLRDAGLNAHGLDNSPSMLGIAARRPGERLSLVRGSFPAPLEDDGFDAVILSLVLHESVSGPTALLRDALRLAPRALILEWRMPERNLDYPGQLITHAIERLAGKEHYRRFRKFAASGWLRGAAYECGARLVREEAAAGGVLVLALAEKN